MIPKPATFKFRVAFSFCTPDELNGTLFSHRSRAVFEMTFAILLLSAAYIARFISYNYNQIGDAARSCARV